MTLGRGGRGPSGGGGVRVPEACTMPPLHSSRFSRCRCSSGTWRSRPYTRIGGSIEHESIGGYPPLARRPAGTKLMEKKGPSNTPYSFLPLITQVTRRERIRKGVGVGRARTFSPGTGRERGCAPPAVGRGRGPQQQLGAARHRQAALHGCGHGVYLR